MARTAHTLVRVALATLLGACNAELAQPQPDGTLETDSVTHTFDLAQHMPPHMAMMFAMSWFGISSKDPQAGGADGSYGNWHWTDAGCNLENNPATCASYNGSEQRSIASRRRPLTGIYSSSGRTPESLRKIDLDLTTVRRPCDQGARIDAFAVQLDSVKFTSRYPSNQQSTTWDIAYRSQLAYLDEADAAGLTNAVAVGMDATVYWHFGSTFGLTTQSQRIAALTDDVADMARIAAAHKSTLRANGKPVLLFYFDSALMTAAEVKGVFDNARTQSGLDFYTVGTTMNASYFAACDALAPWLNLGIWAQAQGATLREKAADWMRRELSGLASSVGNYPGRVVFAGVTPGFDDYTMDWGNCSSREISRDPQVLAGQFDYLRQLKSSGALDVRGIVLETWDDWTEGSEFQPDVAGGSSVLLQLKQELGGLFGDAADSAGDTALTQRWASFGQARNCCFENNTCTAPSTASVGLACTSSGSGGTGGSGGSGSTTAGVTILSPTAGGTSDSPMHVVAQASSGGAAPITAMIVYLDYERVYTARAASLDIQLPAGPGSHHLGVNAWDSTGKVYTRSITVTVASGIDLHDPWNGDTLGADAVEVRADAFADGGHTIVAMKIYVDGNLVWTTHECASGDGSCASIDQWLSLSSGTHEIGVNAWDDSAQQRVWVAKSTVVAP